MHVNATGSCCRNTEWRKTWTAHYQTTDAAAALLRKLQRKDWGRRLLFTENWENTIFTENHFPANTIRTFYSDSYPFTLSTAGKATTLTRKQLKLIVICVQSNSSQQYWIVNEHSTRKWIGQTIVVVHRDTMNFGYSYKGCPKKEYTTFNWCKYFIFAVTK